jgi:hypothetical protein
LVKLLFLEIIKKSVRLLIFKIITYYNHFLRKILNFLKKGKNYLQFTIYHFTTFKQYLIIKQ